MNRMGFGVFLSGQRRGRQALAEPFEGVGELEEARGSPAACPARCRGGGAERPRAFQGAGVDFSEAAAVLAGRVRGRGASLAGRGGRRARPRDGRTGEGHGRRGRLQRPGVRTVAGAGRAGRRVPGRSLAGGWSCLWPGHLPRRGRPGRLGGGDNRLGGKRGILSPGHRAVGGQGVLGQVPARPGGRTGRKAAVAQVPGPAWKAPGRMGGKWQARCGPGSPRPPP